MISRSKFYHLYDIVCLIKADLIIIFHNRDIVKLSNVPYSSLVCVLNKLN